MQSEFKSSLLSLLERDLQKLKNEILAYNDENAIWLTSGQISNSAGNLCIHIVGNLNHFIGTILGHTGYLRDRHAEFHDKDLPREELVERVEGCILTLSSVIPGLSGDSLTGEYPLRVFDKPMSIPFFLMHLAGHLNYHLGQINYHRRLLDSAQGK